MQILLLMMAAIILTFSLSVSNTSAATITESSNSSIQATSKFVAVTVQYSINTTPKKTYYYSDSQGYKGYIPLDYTIQDHKNGITIAVYAGNVYCSSNCPIFNGDINDYQ